MTDPYTFEIVDIPERAGGPGRKPLPNPFIVKVAELLDEDGEPTDQAVSFIVGEPSDSDTVGTIRRMLARAGERNDVSVFKRIEEVDGGTRITFWAVPRIVPVRKPKDSANGSHVNDTESASTQDSSPADSSAPAPAGSVV